MAGDLESALARGRGGHPDLRAAWRDARQARRRCSSAAEAAWQAAPPRRHGPVARGGPVARPRDRRHRQPAATAVARCDARPTSWASTTGPNTYLEEAARVGAGPRDAEREPQIPVGGRLVVAQANPVIAIEPVATKIIEESEIGATIYETLLTTDASGHLVPWLCEKWELVDGGRRCVLTLRGDVMFSDGTPLTAASVKESIEASLRAGGTLPAAFASIRGAAGFRAGDAVDVAGIIARNDHEIELRLDEALPIYPALLTEGSTAIARPADGDDQPAPPHRHRTVPARVPGAAPRRRGAQSEVLAERASASRRDRVPAVAHRVGGRPAVSGWRRSTSRATCCPMTSTTSSGTRASGRGSSKRPRRTPTSSCSTAGRDPSPATWRCAARCQGSSGRGTWSGARSGASPRPLRA